MHVTLPIINSDQQSEFYFGPQGFNVLSSSEAITQASQQLHELNDAALPAHTQSWKIVAQDTELGDPYFIDEEDFTSAVYTTVPGNWTKILVATSVDKFLESLAFLHDVSPQQEAQFLPDESTTSDDKVLAEMESLLSKLSGANAFWADFFICYKDWLLDDDSDEAFDSEYPAE